MNIAKINKTDIANGPGVRVSLFVSGCRHHCKDCFNEEAWSFNYGVPYTSSIETEVIEALRPSHIAGITFLGGEPMEKENTGALLELVKRIKTEFSNKTIWLYSGFTYSELMGLVEARTRSNLTEIEQLLSYVDVLVDGKFEIEKKDITLLFRGSSNQRLIDMNKTRNNHIVTLYNDK